ncbi:MAG: hypothetical protein LUG54_03645 [Clostridiales bacterium]|nr:hypothetical protein [Clostridiales bacterium]
MNRCLGSEDVNRQREALWGGLIICGFMILAGFFLSVITEPVMSLANIPDSMRASAGLYLRIILFSGGFWGLENFLLQIVQALGESRVPAILSVAGTIGKTFLMAALIIRGGMGVEASALAILLNYLGTAAILLFWILRTETGKELFFAPRLPSRQVWFELMKNGCAKSGMMIIIGIGAFIMKRQVNTLADDILVGYAYGVIAPNLIMNSLAALAVTAGLITGQNAARSMSAVRYWNRKLFIWCLGVSAVCIVCAAIFAPQIICLLAGDGLTDTALRARCLILVIQTCSLPLVCLYMILRNSLQSMGSYRILPFLGVLEAGVSLLTAWLFIPRFGYPAVCWSVAVKWGIPAFAGALVYRKRVKRIRG